MEILIATYSKEIISVGLISVFMAISPGADFVLVTRNSMLHSRLSGIYSAIGVSIGIWVHVIYSIAGLAVIISNSILLFSMIKYLGAVYLIYIGWKTFRYDSKADDYSVTKKEALYNFSAFKTGFTTNALNPKTTIFFLSIFTQVVTPQTPLSLQILYGVIISMAHLVWFSSVSIFFSQRLFLKKFNAYKSVVEKCIGTALIGFGIKIAVADNS